MRRLGRRETSEIDVATADIRTLPTAVSGDFRPTLIVIGAAVIFLIVIGYVNVSNLLLVRGAQRSPELIIRRAIGGTRGDIVRLLSLESTALVIMGAMPAVAVAQALRGALLDLAPHELPRTDVIRSRERARHRHRMRSNGSGSHLRRRFVVRRQPMGRIISGIGRRTFGHAFSPAPAAGTDPGRRTGRARARHADRRRIADPHAHAARAAAVGVLGGPPVDSHCSISDDHQV